MTNYSIQSYGAVGDGVTNDAAHIQAAITAAHNAGNGNTVTFPFYKVDGVTPAVYLVTSGITYPSNITLQGITHSGSLPHVKCTSGGTIFKNADTVNGNTNATIDSIYMDCNGSGIGIEAFVQGPAYTGVYTACSNMTFSNNYIYNCTLGINPWIQGLWAYPDLSYLTNINILNNTINTVSNKSIELSATINSTVSGNTISACAAGIQMLYWANNNTISNNIINSAIGGAEGLIAAHGSSGNLFTGNTVTVPGPQIELKVDATAIDSVTADNVFENNTFTSSQPAVQGILLNCNANTQFTNNIIRNNVFVGVPFSVRTQNASTSKVVVTGLLIYNNDFQSIPSNRPLYIGSGAGENTADSFFTDIRVYNNTFSANGSIPKQSKLGCIYLNNNTYKANGQPVTVTG